MSEFKESVSDKEILHEKRSKQVIPISQTKEGSNPKKKNKKCLKYKENGHDPSKCGVVKKGSETKKD